MKTILTSIVVALALVAVPVFASHNSQVPQDCAVDEVLVSVMTDPGSPAVAEQGHFIIHWHFIFPHLHWIIDVPAQPAVPPHFEDMCQLDPLYTPPAPPVVEEESGGGICWLCMLPKVESGTLTTELTVDGQVVHFMSNQMGLGGLMIGTQSSLFPVDEFGKPIGDFFYPFGYEWDISVNTEATYHTIFLPDMPAGAYFVRPYLEPNAVDFPFFGRSYGQEVEIHIF